MTWWLIVAPLREDDDALRTTRWIARVTAERVSPRPTLLLDVDARRARLSECLAVPPSPGGVAFFGHGSDDRLFDVDRAPEADGPSLLDLENIHTCKGWWVHAFACRSGARLARAAADAGVDVYVGYQRPLDACWTPPHGAEEAVARLVTCTTAALAAGE